MPTIRGLAEIVLSVHDLEASLRFYRDILGLEMLTEPDFRPVFLKAGEAAIAVPQLLVLVPLPPGTAPFPKSKTERTLHHLAFELARAEYQPLRERLLVHGLDVRAGLHPVFGFETLYVDDPDGNEVEFLAAQ